MLCHARRAPRREEHAPLPFGYDRRGGARSPCVRRPGARSLRPGRRLRAEPVRRLHRRRAGHELRQQRSRAVRRGEPDESEQHRRGLPAGPLVERRRARPRRVHEPRRRDDLDRVVGPLQHLLRRNGRERRRLRPRVRSLGDVRPERRRLPDQPLCERRRDRLGGARQQVDRRRRHLERADDARPQRLRVPGRPGLQRQGVDHGRSDEREQRLRGLGSQSLSERSGRHHAADERRVDPRRHHPLPDDRRRAELVGTTGHPRPEPERVHDRQPDRRVAGRYARRHLRGPERLRPAALAEPVPPVGHPLHRPRRDLVEGDRHLDRPLGRRA